MKLHELSPSGSTDEQPTWRLWGEEKVNGAVYTVYLKKVRYHSPSKSVTCDDSDDDISHLEWETVRVRFVKAATLERLVECLASEDGELESTYINVFLATYRTFASPEQVTNLLIERYEKLEDPESPIRDEARDQHRKTLRQCLHVWLDQYPEDFANPPKFACLQTLESFCERVMKDTELAVKVRNKGEEIRRSSTSSAPTPPCSPLPPPRSAPLRRQSASMPMIQKLVSSASTCKSPLEESMKDFMDIPDTQFAQQLTKMDYVLFKRVIPHQCLGSVWSRRDKSRDRAAATVLATVEQFNAVSFRVISTILIGPLDGKPSSRAKIITKWIDIAQELRVLKNFSSLKAIISGLQSNPVYRLKKSWNYVSREKLAIFEELARIFSEDNNALAQRELLVREGTARFAESSGENEPHLQKVLQKHSENSRALSYGTIPYLGTFLTDLTMIDTAIPDIVPPEGLVNFDKRRKEFEVLAQIKLLQGAANAYNFETECGFHRWFESVILLDEREAFDLSCKIEPKETKYEKNPSSSASSSSSSSSSYTRNIKKSTNHRKNDSIASTISSASSGSQFFSDTVDSSSHPASSSALSTASGEVPSSASSTSSILDASFASSSNKSDINLLNNNNTPKAAVFSPADSASTSPYRNSEFYIIRVSIESSGPETEGVIMYKSIMISNHERTREVILNAMMKHGLEGSPENYALSQLLPEKELQIPENANVYYAINTQHDLNFILREKEDEPLRDPSTIPDPLATPSLCSKSKPHRDTSKARRKLLGIAL